MCRAQFIRFIKESTSSTTLSTSSSTSSSTTSRSGTSTSTSQVSGIWLLVVNGSNIRRGCAVISKALQPMSCCTILGLSDSHVQLGKWHVLNMKCLSKWLRHGTGSEMFSTSVSDSFHSVVWIEDPSRAWPTILEPLKSQYGEVVWLYCLGLGSVSLDFHQCQLASWFVYEERLDFLVMRNEHYLNIYRNFELNAAWTDLEERVIILCMDLWIYRKRESCIGHN